MQGYSKRSFSAPVSGGHEIVHDVYTQGTGPVVVIIQELPGIGPQTLTLAQKLRDAGFTTVLPHLFGPLGSVSLVGNLVRVLCMRREFRLLEKNATSPVVDWLRALCRDLCARHGVKGVGTIGMCLTGNFAISLLADESVLAGVASQPSMPLGDQSALHMSPSDVESIKLRIDATQPAIALRFAGDAMCTAGKFDAFNRTFNTDRHRIDLHTLPGKGHSVLTLDFVDQAGHPTTQALADVINYFRSALSQQPARPD